MTEDGAQRVGAEARGEGICSRLRVLSLFLLLWGGCAGGGGQYAPDFVADPNKDPVFDAWTFNYFFEGAVDKRQFKNTGDAEAPLAVSIDPHSEGFIVHGLENTVFRECEIILRKSDTAHHYAVAIKHRRLPSAVVGDAWLTHNLALNGEVRIPDDLRGALRLTGSGSGVRWLFQALRRPRQDYGVNRSLPLAAPGKVGGRAQDRRQVSTSRFYNSEARLLIRSGSKVKAVDGQIRLDLVSYGASTKAPASDNEFLFYREVYQDEVITEVVFSHRRPVAIPAGRRQRRYGVFDVIKKSRRSLTDYSSAVMADRTFTLLGATRRDYRLSSSTRLAEESAYRRYVQDLLEPEGPAFQRPDPETFAASQIQALRRNYRGFLAKSSGTVSVKRMLFNDFGTNRGRFSITDRITNMDYGSDFPHSSEDRQVVEEMMRAFLIELKGELLQENLDALKEDMRRGGLLKSEYQPGGHTINELVRYVEAHPAALALVAHRDSIIRGEMEAAAQKQAELRERVGKLEPQWEENMKAFRAMEEETARRAKAQGYIYLNLESWLSLMWRFSYDLNDYRSHRLHLMDYDLAMMKHIFDGNFDRINYQASTNFRFDRYFRNGRIHGPTLDQTRRYLFVNLMAQLSYDGVYARKETEMITYKWSEVESKSMQLSAASPITLHTDVVRKNSSITIWVPLGFVELFDKMYQREGERLASKLFKKANALHAMEDDPNRQSRERLLLNRFPRGSKAYSQYLENLVRYLSGEKSLQDEGKAASGRDHLPSDTVDYPTRMADWDFFACKGMLVFDDISADGELPFYTDKSPSKNAYERSCPRKVFAFMAKRKAATGR